jgi:hypothetical protein
MEETNMTELTPEQIANEASTPGRFSLIDRLRNREYPSEDISIYLAEDAAYTRSALLEEVAEIRVIGTEEEKAQAQAKMDALWARIDAATKAVLDSEVVISVRAISSERYDELIAQARQKFPSKYEKVTNPLTGRTAKEEIESPDRDEYFNDLFLGEVIEKATIGNDVDDQIDATWWGEFKKLAPLDAVRVIVTKAFKMRMVTEWMDEVQHEDFSPRS